MAGESCKCEWAWFRLLKSKLWAHQHLLTNCAGHRSPFSPEERLGSMWQQSCSICSSSGEGSSRTLPFTPTWLPQLHTTVPSSRGPGCSCPHTGSQSDVMAPLGLSSGTLFSPGLTPLPLVLPPPCPQQEEEPFPVSQERREGSCSGESMRCELRAGTANGLMMTGRGLASVTAAWQPGTDWICALHTFWEHTAFLC